MHHQDLVPTLQLSVAPIILVSGVGLILLSLTNRFGRVIDRTRALAPIVAQSTGLDYERNVKQIRVLWRRALIIRAGIALGLLSVLLASLLVMGLFAGTLFMLPMEWLLISCFVLCVGSLVGCLGCFLADINLSLHALRHEIPECAYQKN
jgi:hypothetical protein